MHYMDFLAAVDGSSPEHWKTITCWGGGGPSFLEGYAGHPRGGDPDDDGRDSHGMRAVYLPDVSIGLAWGIRHNDDFKESWANDHTPDSRATSHFVDVFYNGMLVDRWIRVTVDGGRCGLPIPERVEAEDGTVTWFVSPRDAGRARLIQGLESGGYDVDQYLQRCGISIR